MTGWSWAHISGDGGSTNYDRRQADRRSRALAPRSNGNYHSDHYAAKAEAREAMRREAEEYRAAVKNSHEWRDRDDAGKRFDRDNPRPPATDPDDPDFLERMAEEDAWWKQREECITRAEGEKLAARIARS
ncbi:hypothetical protein [Streptomyces tendae]|uniref:hypothetical protein n=1 Tax=Streptomyces tendae TaxID=1932 RepID=UPI00372367F6